MIGSDLGQLNTVRIHMVGGDRIFRQGSTVKRVFRVVQTIAGVVTPVDISTLSIRTVSFRDAQNDQLVMSGTGALEAGLGVGYFSVTIDSDDTEAVDPATFPFLPEVFTIGRETVTWMVLTGVYDVEFYSGSGPELVGCPVEGFWKMRRGVSRP